MSHDPVSQSATRPVSNRLLAVGVLIGLVALAGIAFSGIASRNSVAAQLESRAREQSIPTVRVSTPGKGGAVTSLDLPGRLDAWSRAPLYARVSGYLRRWTVDIGATVKAGQLIAEIDTPDLDQQLLQARADLASATSVANLAAASARRWQSLVARDAVSRQEADEKSADAVTRQAVASSAQANLDRLVATKEFARIVAPFDGVVTARSTDIGALVNAGAAGGQELFVVSDLRRLRLYVTVPQSYAATVRRGTRAIVRVPERPGVTYSASVATTAQAVTAAAGGMLVQLVVDNPRGELLPGGFASVSLELPSTQAALAVSPSALIFDRNGLRVAVVGAGDKVVMRTVTIARDLGRSVELASGLDAGDRVIDNPPEGIADGDTVRVAEAAAR
jgi:RND family efflux transporter MFP subunit